MLTIEKKGEKIYDAALPRGDNGELELSINGYNLETGDKIIFKLGKDLNRPIIKKIVTDFFDNCLSVSLLPAETNKLLIGKYFYVVKLIKSDGEVDTLIEKSVFTLEDS